MGSTYQFFEWLIDTNGTNNLELQLVQELLLLMDTLVGIIMSPCINAYNEISFHGNHSTTWLNIT